MIAVWESDISDNFLIPPIELYFPLVFEVIGLACFALTSAAPFIVSSMLLLASFWYFYYL